jgi:hypothetical protein
MRIFIGDASPQKTFREHSGNIQGTFREHSGNIQGTFREHVAHPSSAKGSTTCHLYECVGLAQTYLRILGIFHTCHSIPGKLTNISSSSNIVYDISSLECFIHTALLRLTLLMQQRVTPPPVNVP